MLQLKDRIYGKNNIDKNEKPNYDKEIFYILNKGKLHKYNRDQFIICNQLIPKGRTPEVWQHCKYTI